LGTAARAAKSALLARLDDPNEPVRLAAASALEMLGFQLTELGDAFVALTIDSFLSEFFARARDEIDAEVRVSVWVTAGWFDLPLFSWPNPPTPAHIEPFGQNIPRSLLGGDAATLGAVYHRLVQALFEIDPAFESSVFGVPGGFALLAKIERIREDGSPLPPPYRWTLGQIPPLSLSDYVGQLFFEKPGYFRELAFVVTDEEYSPENPHPRSIPDIGEGALDLPGELARDLLEKKKAYLLVYSFVRERGGRTRELRLSGLSASIHLQKSGVLGSLSTQP